MNGLLKVEEAHVWKISGYWLWGNSVYLPSSFSILFPFSLNLRLIFIVQLSENEGDNSEVKIVPWLPTLAALPAGNRWIYSYYSIEYDA